MVRGRVVWLSALVAVFALGCGGNSGVPQGHERGPCYDNGTCEPGLTCASDLCVNVVVDGGTGGSANPGTAGAGAKGGSSASGTGGSLTGGSGGPGSGGTAGSATGGAGTGGTGGSGTGGTFAAAPHPALPQLANLGGPVLTTPKVRPIFFAGETNQAEIMSFLFEVAAGSYWSATTSEYGVGPLTVLAPITNFTTASSTVVDDSALQSALVANTSAFFNPPWGMPDSQTAYVFVIPPSVTLTFGTSTCCTDFGGYHYETIVNGAAVPYVVACACPNFLGAGMNSNDERTAAMSHELVEVATDPYPLSDPAVTQANQANYVWTLVTGGEAGDMCVIDGDPFVTPTGARHVVQKSWSNAAARAGQDPCVPASTTTPYFNSMPELDLVTIGGYGAETRGLQIPIGSSHTVDLDLFSAGDIPNGWNVQVTGVDYGSAPSLSFALDRTSGKNGDVLRLTISALRTNSVLGFSPFVILSSIGTKGTTGYQSHVSMGLVTN